MKKITLLLSILFLASVSISAQSYTPPVGSQYQGGKVAYIFRDGDAGYIPGEVHGLIAAPVDVAGTFTWYHGNYSTTGAVGITLGEGMTNTNTIVSKQGIYGVYAAKACTELLLNGYYDWFLPSEDELNMLYKNRFKIGGFGTGVYWSSTEVSNQWACSKNFDTGYRDCTKSKATVLHVRAVRIF